MNLILCCGNAALLKRWTTALQQGFATYQATTLQDLRILVGQQIIFDLLLVHASQVDREIVAYIRERKPGCKLFILADRPDEEEGVSYLRLGVVGYANSYMGAERLQEAIRAIASGSVWINQQLMQRLIAGVAPSSQQSGTALPESSPPHILTCLTNREQQIAHLVATGHANLEIAAHLGITERTVKAHLGAIYAKTSTKGRLGLALLIQNNKGPAGE